MPKFVLHDHRAKRAGHHYDLRLAWHKYVKSFAMRKSFPMSMGIKRLAFEQPKHSYASMKLEGEVKTGYGAGRFKILDSGKYELLDQTPEKLVLTFHGKKIKGGYAIVKFGSRNKWLILRRSQKQIISKCTIKDLDKLKKIEDECFSKRFRFSKNDYQSFLKASDVKAYKITIDDDIAGFIFLQYIGNKVHEIVTLNVNKKYRNIGIATKLLKFIEEKISRPSILLLQVYSNNRSAINLYRKLNYQRSGVAKNYYGKGYDAVYMKKILKW